jgi:2-dehydro-3-deoxygalactonokinase
MKHAGSPTPSDAQVAIGAAEASAQANAEANSQAVLIALDWGTTSLRAYLYDASGKVLATRASTAGIMNLPRSAEQGGFDAAFEDACGAWLDAAPGTPVIAAGMVGSAQGWLEAPYVDAPANADALAAGIVRVKAACGATLHIIPGVLQRGELPNVMRGEETQIFGALDMLGLDDALFVLPGTHSKWAEVRGGRVERFSTAMTGEVYALLRHHSILARTLPSEDGPLHGEAFDSGVERALRSTSLLQSAFTVRTLALFERSTPDELASYLSGLVIGEELRTQGSLAGRRVHLIGNDTLTRRYQRALARAGAEGVAVGAQATWRGLWNIARSLQE